MPAKRRNDHVWTSARSTVSTPALAPPVVPTNTSWMASLAFRVVPKVGSEIGNVFGSSMAQKK